MEDEARRLGISYNGERDWYRKYRVGTENTEFGIRRGTHREEEVVKGWTASKGIELHFTGWQDRGNKWVA